MSASRPTISRKDLVPRKSFCRARLSRLARGQVRSRFVQRLAAVAGETRWKQALQRGARYTDYARALDHPAKVSAMPRPQPVPPPDARPSQLSVTDIENWLRDPYTIYAKHVLRLFPLDPIDTPPGAADRGTFIHEAIGEFTKKHADALPADVERALTELGKKHFEPLKDFEEARAFWWTRFLRIAGWFEGWERERRDGASKIFAEMSGKHAIPLGKTEFVLTARTDRIERRADGSYALLDYKTGQPPTDAQVRSGLAPSSRWKRQSCAQAVSRKSLPRRRCPKSSMCG